MDQRPGPALRIPTLVNGPPLGELHPQSRTTCCSAQRYNGLRAVCAIVPRHHPRHARSPRSAAAAHVHALEARRLVAHRSLVSPLPDKPRAQATLRADCTHSPHMTFQGYVLGSHRWRSASLLTGVRHARQSDRGARLLDAAVLMRLRQFRWSASQSDELRRPGAMTARRVGPSTMKGAGRRSHKTEPTWLDW